MLVLTRRVGESIIIGDDITVTISKINGGQVALAVNAPKEVPVWRKEVYDKISADGKVQSNAL